jgi:hypothetical protein
MKKIRAFLVAFILAITTIGLGVASSVTPVSATLSNCVRGGEYYRGGHYAGIVCFSTAPTGGFVSIRIMCQYYYLYQYHTYTRSSIPQAAGNWSWVSCGNSGHQPVDYIIHVQPIMTPSYLDVGSAWNSLFLF